MVLKIRGVSKNNFENFNNKSTRKIVKATSFDNFSDAKNQLPLAVDNPYGDEIIKLPFLS